LDNATLTLLRPYWLFCNKFHELEPGFGEQEAEKWLNSC